MGRLAQGSRQWPGIHNGENVYLSKARKATANEGELVHDVTPDWIRARGIWWTDGFQSGPY